MNGSVVLLAFEADCSLDGGGERAVTFLADVVETGTVLEAARSVGFVALVAILMEIKNTLE